MYRAPYSELVLVFVPSKSTHQLTGVPKIQAELTVGIDWPIIFGFYGKEESQNKDSGVDEGDDQVPPLEPH